jgi:hypothetical protein
LVPIDAGLVEVAVTLEGGDLLLDAPALALELGFDPTCSILLDPDLRFGGRLDQEAERVLGQPASVAEGTLFAGVFRPVRRPFGLAGDQRLKLGEARVDIGEARL